MTQLDLKRLNAYVDDQLDDADRKLFEAAVSRNSDLQQRLADYTAQRNSLRAMYNPVIREPLPDRFTLRQLEAEHGHKSLREFAMAACLLTVIIVGGTMAFYYRTLAPETYLQTISSALQAHKTANPITSETLSQAQVSSLMQAEVAFPDLSELGLNFVHALSLGTPSEPRVALIYNDAADQPTTLYLAPLTTTDAPSVHGVRNNSLHALYWTNDVISCTIVSATEDVNQVAGKAFAQLTPSAPVQQPRQYRDG